MLFYVHDCMEAGGRAAQEQLPRMCGRKLLLHFLHFHHPWWSYAACQRPTGMWEVRVTHGAVTEMARNGDVHDCMEGIGATTWKWEIELRREQQPRLRLEQAVESQKHIFS